MSRIRVLLLAVAVIALSGCASSMSGVGGTDKYACKAPEGALCTSVSGVYANSIHGTLPIDKAPTTNPKAAKPAPYGTASIAPGSPALSVTAGSTVRSSPRVLRVWIAPWEDSDGDLHEESFIHLLADTGRWLIEHVRPAGRSRVDGVAPPSSLPGESPAPKQPGDTPSPIGRLPLSPGISAGGSEITNPIER